MKAFNPDTAVTRQTQRSRIWLAHDDRRQEWVVEVTIREKNGLRYLVNRYRGAQPSWQALRQDARRHGHFSPRPYQLRQACDGSITTCVVALFENFCRAHGLDPVALMRQAYPDEHHATEDFQTTRQDADWEGTAYPKCWNRAAVDGLLESLHEVNYHSLTEVVEEAFENLDLSKRGVDTTAGKPPDPR